MSEDARESTGALGTNHLGSEKKVTIDQSVAIFWSPYMKPQGIVIWGLFPRSLGRNRYSMKRKKKKTKQKEGT